MKSIITGILSLFIFFGAVPSVQAVSSCEMTCEMACANEEIKKKKKGFFSKVFGSK